MTAIKMPNFSVFVNHQQEFWVNWLPHLVFAAYNKSLESWKCTTIFALLNVNPEECFTEVHKTSRNCCKDDANLVKQPIYKVYNHLWVEMGWSNTIKKKNVNTCQIPNPIIHSGLKIQLYLGYFWMTWRSWDVE